MTDEQINEALVELRRSMNTLLVQRAVDTPQTMTISDWTAVIP